MLQFDPKKPFSEVWGLPGVAYNQDGNSFNARGELITDYSALKPILEVDKSPTPNDGSVPKCYMADEKPSAAEEMTKDYEKMHWSKLRAMLSIYGEEYQSREHAVSYLKGLQK